MAKRASRAVVRSAVTGRFVRSSRAKSSPRTTVKDTVGGAKGGQAVKVSRSAITGRFISKATAKRHPSTTVTETVRRGK